MRKLTSILLATLIILSCTNKEDYRIEEASASNERPYIQNGLTCGTVYSNSINRTLEGLKVRNNNKVATYYDFWLESLQTDLSLSRSQIEDLIYRSGLASGAVIQQPLSTIGTSHLWFKLNDTMPCKPMLQEIIVAIDSSNTFDDLKDKLNSFSEKYTHTTYSHRYAVVKDILQQAALFWQLKENRPEHTEHKLFENKTKQMLLATAIGACIGAQDHTAEKITSTEISACIGASYMACTTYFNMQAGAVDLNLS